MRTEVMEQGSGAGEIAIFEAETGEIQVQVQEESVWLSQRQMAEVFDTSTDNISLHLKNIFADGEMTEEPAAEDFSVVRQEYAAQDQGLGADILYEEIRLE